VPLLPTLRVRGAGGHGREPITVGVALGRGCCTEPDALGLRDGAGRWIPVQWEVLSRWPDGSVQWALLDFQAAAEAPDDLRLQIEARPTEAPRDGAEPAWAVRPGQRQVEIDNGRHAFVVSARDGSVLVSPRGVPGGPSVTIDSCLTTMRGEFLTPRLRGLTVEASGPVRTTVRASGEFRLGVRRRVRYHARISLYAGSGAFGMEVALHNPAAARHRGGRWDLGDPRSALFRDFSVVARLSGSSRGELAWKTDPDDAWQGPAATVEIHQESSGGENWRSRNHVDRRGEVPLRFRGYRVRSPGGESQGLRASPVVALTGPGFRVAAAVEQFWQNFPKAVEGSPDSIRLRLHPRESAADGFELQPGERKTHRVWLDVTLGAEAAAEAAPPLAWVHRPRSVSPERLVEGAVRAAEGAAEAADATARLMAAALDGPSSFFAKREVIDEYGWRHFGEVYADHENAYFEGERPVVSHYNNQYDLVGGFLVQYLLVGDRRWHELATDLARHVMDIDCYRTTDDRPAYNGGLFWHTDHYDDAHRATHRTYSADSRRAAGGAYGGGPSNEHNYTSGLLLFHYLTGSPDAREMVVGLAEWVLAMDDGRRTLLGALDDGPTGAASATSSVLYHGPGRGPGNSINALLDAFTVDGRRRFLAKAEELVRRCIHPRDDIDARRLLDLEARWSYLVFLQALGRYLELKVERREFDGPFFHARESLLAYARWMREHEVPYRSVLDRVEFPTETWPAHDLRKAVVFGFAVRHGPAEEAAGFREASRRFRAEGLAGMAAFETCACTRPLAIVLQNEPLWAWLMSVPPADAPPLPAGHDFGAPSPFAPQRARVLAKLRRPAGLLALAARLAYPPRLLDFLRAGAAEARRRWL
jgi:hypothetical protein